MGLLVVQGTIDLAQFWSNGGESDGDTTHVAVKEVTFNDKPTKIFDGAYVKGRGKSEVIKKGAVTVRWQGIDSPELHYIPQVKGTHVAEAHNFRQHYGQAATRALLGLLKDLAGGAATIDARVTSQVHHPNDVFDTYGRMIGTVIVKGRDLNHWMVEEGWAFPTFYSSMSAEEIIPLREAAQKAAMTKRGIWKEFSTKLDFDPSLRFQKNGAPADDPGAVLMPKLFRRLSTAYVATGDTTGFKRWLQDQAKPDRAYLTEELLEDGIHSALQYDLADFIHGHRFAKRPDELVFQEASSTLYSADGHKITQW